MSILRIKQEDGTWVEIPALIGSKGDKGDPYILTDADKTAIATMVKNSLVLEHWTFTLEDGTTVTKAVYVG